MYFEVLGPLEVRTDAGDVVAVPDRKVRALLLDLLVHRGRPVSADRLIDDLWGDTPPRNATGTLQARVSQLRSALDRAEPGARSVITHGPAGYTLTVGPDVVDSNEFERLLDTGRLAEALRLWRGPAYADVADAGFARAERERLEELRIGAIEQLALQRLDSAEPPDAILAMLAEPLDRYPLRERLREVQLRALYQAGRHTEALRVYADLRTTMADELGAEPGPELQGLHLEILRHDPDLTASRTTVPVPVNELIGRERAVAETRRLLEQVRLVTLTGPGGVGKTRLALEVARAQPRPVWFVELAGAAADDVLDTVGRALGLREDLVGSARPGRPEKLVERLVSSLSLRPCLLVLDNCEHVLEPVTELVARLLRGGPLLRILATSREPLVVEGEHLVEVPPLDPEAAAELFTARARAAAGVVDDADALATICRRLDGIPLALELAATRVRALGVRTLAEKLDDRFRVLTGARGMPERQRTLRAAIDWSWDLLSEQERAMLRRLAVHADSFTMEAAEEVSDLAGDELVARLVDRSLVVASGGRYRLPETVAAYSLDRLVEAGEEEWIRRRHASYYVALTERAEPYLRGPQQRVWLERLDQESANLRVALQYAPPEQALRLVNAAAWYWYLRGRHGEARRALRTALARADGSGVDSLADAPGRTAGVAGGVGSVEAGGVGSVGADRAAATVWLVGLTATSADGADLTSASEAALGLYGPRDDPLRRARADWFLTATQWAYGDPAVLMARIDRAVDTFERLGDRWGLAAALSTRAQLHLAHADLAALRRDGLESLRLFEELGDAWGRLQASGSLIAADEIAGDYPAATARLEESLRLAKELGMWTEVSFRTAGLGRIALLAGAYQRADELHEQARRLAIEQSNKSAEEYAEVGLGISARRQGRLDDAERHLTRWLDWLRQIGGLPGVAFILAQLGYVAEQRGDLATAHRLHSEGLAAARATGDERAVALALEGLAGATIDPVEAQRLLTEAERLRDKVGVPLPAGERFDVDRLRKRLAKTAPGQSEEVR